MSPTEVGRIIYRWVNKRPSSEELNISNSAGGHPHLHSRRNDLQLCPLELSTLRTGLEGLNAGFYSTRTTLDKETGARLLMLSDSPSPHFLTIIADLNALIDVSTSPLVR